MTTLASPYASPFAAPARDTLWTRTLTLVDGGKVRTLTLTNMAGRNYPTLDDAQMIELLGILPHEHVLDIGGGDSPFSRADVVTDAFLENNAHRSGRAVQSQGGKQFVPCFAESLPFPDQNFDFAYCRMVLEHTIDPEAACREMMRVARRGFLETPSPLSEYLGGHPTHRWIVWVETSPTGGPTLVFRRRPFRRAPFSYVLRGRWFTDPEFRFRWEWQFRNLACTQLAWEGSFAFRVETDDPDALDYDDPFQAAESHLDAAIDGLRFGGVPYDIIRPDIEEALRLRPNWAMAYNAHGCALWAARQYPSAHTAFVEAARLDPANPAYRANANLRPGPQTHPQLELFREAEKGIQVFGYSGIQGIKQEEGSGAGRVLDIHRSDIAPLDAAGDHLVLDPVEPNADSDFQLPYEDDAFAEVSCREVLQTQPDPAAFCRELQRIAPQGVIETPSPFAENMTGDPAHRWLISWEAETRTLVFRRKTTGRSPFMSLLTPAIRKHADLRHSYEVSYRHLTHTRVTWDREHPFAVRVEDDPEDRYDFQRPQDAFPALLLYTEDLLHGDLPAEALQSAGRALRLRPRDPGALRLLMGVIDRLRQRPPTALQAAPKQAQAGEDLNADDSRWAEIYERINLEEIPYHFGRFMSMPFLADYLRKAVELCPPGGRALETGVGYGYGAIWLSLHGAQADGIDYSDPIVARAQAINRMLGGTAAFKYGDMFQLDTYVTGPYDLIFHQGVLEHFSDTEIRTILRQQTNLARRVLFSVPSCHYPFEKEFGNERLMTVEQWREILAEFDIELLTYYGDPRLGGQEHVLGVLRGNPHASSSSEADSLSVTDALCAVAASAPSAHVPSSLFPQGPALSPRGWRSAARSVCTSHAFTRPSSLLWQAPLYEPCGYADEARHFLFALHRAGHTGVSARPIKWSQKVAELSEERAGILKALTSHPVTPGSIHICHTIAPHFQREPSARVSVGRTMFETDRLPAGWADACNRMDAVWVPSAFNVETFANAGVAKEKLHIVPGTLDFADYDPGCRPLTIPGARGFNFLTVFDWTLRKGWDVLLRAYVDEFDMSEDVALIIKTHSGLGYTTAMIADAITLYLVRTLGRDPNRIPDVILQDIQISDAQMPALYRAADCFVLPTRGEGWGRPLMEAMAMELPAIATNWSGQTAFMTADNSLLIGYELVDVPEAGWRETPTYQGHRWAEPSVADLRAQMRRAFEDRSGGREIGKQARAHLEHHFAYPVVAQILAEELERIG